MENLDAILKPVRETYLRSLENRIKHLSKLLEKSEFEKLLSGIHRLKGSGKTLGFSEISNLCLEIENHLKKIKNSPSKPDNWAKIKGLLLNLALAEQKYRSLYAENLANDVEIS